MLGGGLVAGTAVAAGCGAGLGCGAGQLGAGTATGTGIIVDLDTKLPVEGRRLVQPGPGADAEAGAFETFAGLHSREALPEDLRPCGARRGLQSCRRDFFGCDLSMRSVDPRAAPRRLRGVLFLGDVDDLLGVWLLGDLSVDVL
jgi:hypothetical protein